VDHMAMRAALAGRGLDAARIAGYADAIRAQKEAPREPTEARARATASVARRANRPQPTRAAFCRRHGA